MEDKEKYCGADLELQIFLKICTNTDTISLWQGKRRSSNIMAAMSIPKAPDLGF